MSQDHWSGMKDAQMEEGFSRLAVGKYIAKISRCFIKTGFKTPAGAFIAEMSVTHAAPGAGQAVTGDEPCFSFYQDFGHNRAMAQKAIFTFVCHVLGYTSADKDAIDREVRPYIEQLMSGVTGAANPLMGCHVSVDSEMATWPDKKNPGQMRSGTNQTYSPAPFDQIGVRRPTVAEIMQKIQAAPPQGYASQTQGAPAGATPSNPWGQPQSPPAGAWQPPPPNVGHQASVFGPGAPPIGAPAQSPPWAQPGHAGPPPGQGTDWVSPQAAPAPGAWAPSAPAAPAGPPPWSPPPAGPSYPPGTEFHPPGSNPGNAQGFRYPGGQWTQIVR